MASFEVRESLVHAADPDEPGRIIVRTDHHALALPACCVPSRPLCWLTPAALIGPTGREGTSRGMGRYWLGIDIGGTFTDFTLYDTTTHGVTGLKVPSTPSDFADAVQDGLARLAGEHGVDPRQIDVVVHGTTIAVNTLIQRTGARLGLLVTEGFRDILEIQRLRLPNPLDMFGGRPEPLIPRARVAEVRERLRADGRVDTALDEAGVADAARRLARRRRRGPRDQPAPRLPRARAMNGARDPWRRPRRPASR